MKSIIDTNKRIPTPGINPFWEHVYCDTYRCPNKQFVVKSSGYRGRWTIVLMVPIDAEHDVFVRVVSTQEKIADHRKAFAEFLAADPDVVINEVLERSAAQALAKSKDHEEQVKRWKRISLAYEELKFNDPTPSENTP